MDRPRIAKQGTLASLRSQRHPWKSALPSTVILSLLRYVLGVQGQAVAIQIVAAWSDGSGSVIAVELLPRCDINELSRTHFACHATLRSSSLDTDIHIKACSVGQLVLIAVGHGEGSARKLLLVFVFGLPTRKLDHMQITYNVTRPPAIVLALAQLAARLVMSLNTQTAKACDEDMTRVVVCVQLHTLGCHRLPMPGNLWYRAASSISCHLPVGM